MVVALTGLSSVAVCAAENETYLLLKEGAKLLGESGEICALPATYFAVYVAEDELCYSVKYGDLQGKIEKAFAEKVDYEPVTKTHSAYFTADNDTHSVNVRRYPRKDAEIIASLPDKAKAYLYGETQGDEIVSGAGAVWYLIKFNGETGYVYSAQGEAQKIPRNKIEKVEVPAPPPSVAPKNTDWIFIIALCVPAVTVMFAIFGKRAAN